jgi:hypothetical protein
MTDEQARAATGPALTNIQRDRVGFARRDLEAAQAADLPQQDHAQLILIITRLCTRLGDTLALLTEVAEVEPPAPPP